MAVKLVFETHATSLDNEAGLASGHYDVDLSPAGERQAAEMGARYREHLPALVLSSDLRRAWRTAEIAFGRAVPISRDPRLRECDYGTLTRKPAKELDPLRVPAIGTPFPGGASYTHCVEQVRGVLDELRAAAPSGWVLMIGHRATHYALDVLLNGASLEDLIRTPFKWQPGWSYEVTGRR